MSSLLIGCMTVALSEMFFSAGLSLWTTWILCVNPQSRPLCSVTLVRTLLLVTVPRVETRPLATALAPYYPRELPPWTPLIRAGVE